MLFIYLNFVCFFFFSLFTSLSATLLVKMFPLVFVGRLCLFKVISFYHINIKFIRVNDKRQFETFPNFFTNIHNLSVFFCDENENKKNASFQPIN